MPDMNTKLARFTAAILAEGVALYGLIVSLLLLFL